MVDGNETALGGQGEAAAATGAPALGGQEGAAHWSEALPEDFREAAKGFESADAFKAALAKPEIPEAYTLPEGIEVDQAVFDAFAPLAKELGLPQAAVEKLLAFDGERMKGLPEKLVAAQDETNRAELKTWASEIGAEKYGQALDAANLALKTFAEPEDIKWLQQAGLGNHPRLVKLFANIGANLREESPAGGEQHGKAPTPEERTANLYPSMKE